MRQILAVVVGLTLLALACGGSAFARTAGGSVKLAARMDSRQVVPQKPSGNVRNAIGTLTGSLAGSGGSPWKLSWQVAYKKLDNPSIVIADIHYGKPGKFGPIIVRLCGPCKSGQKGVTKVKGTWVPAIKSGSAFITLITGQNPNGEIRGQIKAH
jgi:hypothetical protein